MKRSTLCNSLILITFFTSVVFSQDSSMVEGTVKNGTERKKEYEAQFNTQKTLFTVGSVLTFAGLLSITVSGNDRMVAPVGGTLFGLGHVGLIMSGISSSRMKKIIIEANGKDEYSWAPQSGWGYYGAGWGAIAAGIPVIAIGIKNDITPMVFGGIGALGLGEILHIVSWAKFYQSKKYWDRNFSQLSFSPSIYFDKDKKCMLGCNLKYKF